jgi:hypothetical protein
VHRGKNIPTPYSIGSSILGQSEDPQCHSAVLS